MKTFLKPAAFLVATLFATVSFAGAQRARIDFSQAGSVVGSLSTGAACAGSDNQNCVFAFGGGTNPLSILYDAAASTFGFTMSATGATFALDATDDEGAELSFLLEASGATPAAAGPCVFTVGTSAAFYMKAKFKLPTVADYDVALAGFREVETQADLDDPADINTTSPVITDYALVNSNVGDFRIYTSIAGATAVDTNITTANWADAEAHTILVRVSSAGAVTYFVDAVAATGAVAYTFANATVVMPVIDFGASATAGGTDPELQLFECGLQ